MDRFLKKIRLDSCSSSDEELTSEPVNSIVGNRAEQVVLSQNTETLLPCKPGKVRLSNEDYLAIGFTWSGDENFPLLECVICREKLSNASMAPTKLKRHFSTKHTDLANKTMEYFKRLRKELKMQASKFQKNFQVTDKTQVASYLVAELVAKQMKAHTIAESLILPACQAIVKTVFGVEAEKEINIIPLSDNTISRRITDMSNDIEANVTEKLKGCEFALQADESIDISGKAQLLTFIHFIYDG